MWTTKTDRSANGIHGTRTALYSASRDTPALALSFFKSRLRSAFRSEAGQMENGLQIFPDCRSIWPRKACLKLAGLDQFNNCKGVSIRPS
jgi:hypothetical protein